MRPSHSFALVTLFMTTGLAMAACGGGDDHAQDPSQQNQYPQGQPGQQYPQQGYPPQQQPTAAAPTATAPPQPVIGIPCQADSGCGLNKCNPATKVCAPCASAADCQSGGCAVGICVPGVAQ